MPTFMENTYNYATNTTPQRFTQSKQRNDLIKFNIKQLNMVINSFEEGEDCEAE